MPVAESRKKDGIRASVEIFEYLLKHCYSTVNEISKATGYNKATVSKVICGVLNPVINGKAGYKGEGGEKRYLSLYSIDGNKLSDIAVLTDILMRLDPQYMPEGLKKSLERYVAPIIKQKLLELKIIQTEKELKEISNESTEEIQKAETVVKDAKERFMKILEEF